MIGKSVSDFGVRPLRAAVPLLMGVAFALPSFLTAWRERSRIVVSVPIVALFGPSVGAFQASVRRVCAPAS